MRSISSNPSNKGELRSELRDMCLALPVAADMPNLTSPGPKRRQGWPPGPTWRRGSCAIYGMRTDAMQAPPPDGPVAPWAFSGSGIQAIAHSEYVLPFRRARGPAMRWPLFCSNCRVNRVVVSKATTWKGEIDMTKAKARARAKARAAAKAAKPDAKGGKSEAPQRPGHFDVKSGGMRNISGANIKSAAGMKRGAARSR